MVGDCDTLAQSELEKARYLQDNVERHGEHKANLANMVRDTSRIETCYIVSRIETYYIVSRIETCYIVSRIDTCYIVSRIETYSV